MGTRNRLLKEGCYLKIPNEIKIGGIKYQIKEVEPDSHELVNGTTIGHIYFDKQLIVLANNLPEDRKLETTIHEIIHAVLLAMGIHTNDEVLWNEKFINAFTSYLHPVIEQICIENK